MKASANNVPLVNIINKKFYLSIAIQHGAFGAALESKSADKKCHTTPGYPLLKKLSFCGTVPHFTVPQK